MFRKSVALLIVFSAVVFAHAQETSKDADKGYTVGSWDISGGAGGTLRSGANNSNYPNFNFAVGTNLNDLISVYGEYGYTILGTEEQGSGTSSNSVKTGIQNFGVITHFNLEKKKAKRAMPYATLGFGFSHFALSTYSDTHTLQSKNADGTHTSLGFGESIYLGNNWGIRPEVRAEATQFFNSNEAVGWNARETISLFYQFKKWSWK